MKPSLNFQSVVVLLLLLLASIHCIGSIFYVNSSWLDLDAYRNGTERMPFQGRVGMMPVLDFAERSPTIHRVVDKLNEDIRANHKKSAFQDLTPSKLACMAAALLSLLGAVLVAVRYGWRRFHEMWWLPAALLLAILFVTQASRYEVALWYPYDLPHLAIFGTACLFILHGKWKAAFLLFLIDTPVRETAIFLASVTFASAWGRNQKKQGILWAGAMVAVWMVFRTYINHKYAANLNETRVDLPHILHQALNPMHWPQIASAFGFFLLPLCLQSWRLRRNQRFFILGAIPCVLATLAFGVWPESRIFNEWALPSAVLLSSEIMHYIRSQAHRPSSAIVPSRSPALPTRIAA